jgi:DNA invertase Pin-like site-specific DNA recombinase
MSNDNKKTIAYLRVSTVKQLDGAGPDQQRAAISAWAMATSTTENPVMINEFVVDAESGDIEDRTEVIRLKQMAVEGELKLIIVDRLDRFARDSLVSEVLYRFFKLHGVKVIAVAQSFDDSPSGVAMRQMLAVFAQLDKANRISHLRACRKATVARKGTFAGGGVPYGYANKPGTATLELVPGETKLVARTFELSAAGNGLSQIARILTEEGFKTRKGTVIAPMTVSRILAAEEKYRAHEAFGNTKLNEGVKAAQPAVLK